MGDEYPFYGGTPPHQRHSNTSREAAVKVASKSKTLREKVFAYLEARPEGATDDEIQVDLDMQSDTERPRRRELQKAGRVVDSGYVRNTRSGRSAVVWKIVPPKPVEPEQGRLQL